jgi:hypothetical protein
MTENFIKYYNIEDYLFNIVNKKFHKEGNLNAFDFFCIVIWKANRAKSKIANRLIKNGSLESVCKKITSKIFNAKNDEERLEILFNYGFRFPMASAILTVLYPDKFTVYDVRVCNILNKYFDLANTEPNNKNIHKKIKTYFEFVNTVRNHPETRALSLRDKDRYLWGKSFYDDLRINIKNKFGKK